MFAGNNPYSSRGDNAHTHKKREMDTLISDTQNGSSNPLVEMPALFPHQ